MWGKMCVNGLIVKLITIIGSYDSLFGSGLVDRFEVGGDGSLSIVNA